MTTTTDRIIDATGRPPRSARPGTLALAAIWLVGVAGLWWTLTPTPSHLLTNLFATYLLGWGGLALLAGGPPTIRKRPFALMTGAIGLTFALIEAPAAAGLVNYGRLFPANRIEPLLIHRSRPDPELGHIHPPHSRQSGTTQGDLVVSTNTRVARAPWYRYDVRYDARGFRNEADLDRADIAVIGDSFIEGVQVPAGGLMTAVLARHRGTVVANLGQITYGPREELAVLRRFAVPLRPKVCVWTFFEGNDLVDLRRYDRWKSGAIPPASPPTFGDRSFTRNALLAAIRLAGLDRSRYDEFLKRSGLFRKPEGEEVRLFFHYPSLPLTDEDHASLDAFARILGEAREVCAPGAIRLVVAIIPTKFHIYGDLCRFGPGSPCLEWRPNGLIEAVRGIVAGVSPEIGFLDLTGPFRAEAARGTLLYYPDDTHWSPEGQALAGRLLAEYLATSVDAR